MPGISDLEFELLTCLAAIEVILRPAPPTSPSLVSFRVKLAEEFMEKYICKLLR